MRILFHVYIPLTPRAAGIQQSIRVCYYLAKVGVSVSLHVCSWYFNQKQDLLDFFGLDDHKNFEVVFYKNPFGKMKNRRLLFWYGFIFHFYRLFKLLLTKEKNKYDVFFARGHRFPCFHIFLKRILRYKIVYEVHEIIYLDKVAEEDLDKVNKNIDFEKYAYLKADGAIFISDCLRKFVEKRWGAVNPVITIPSGAILFESDSLQNLERLLKIYYVGNYYPFSGLDDCIRALVKLPAATLTIVGGAGPGDRDYERVLALVKELDLKDRVIFRGFVEPSCLHEVYAEAHMLVLPLRNSIRAKYFMSPLKLFEYMSARRPIVASGVPVAKEILRDRENAVLYTPEDPDSLAATILQVMENPALAEKISEAAYQEVQQYSMENKCLAIRNFLQEVVATND